MHNLKDFPQAIVEKHEIEIQHPDEYLANNFNLRPQQFYAALERTRQRLKNPPYVFEAYLDNLVRQGLVVTVTEIQSYGAEH